MGLFSSLFVFTVLRDILLLAAGLILSPGHDASLTLWSGQWTLILAVLVTLDGALDDTLAFTVMTG